MMLLLIPSPGASRDAQPRCCASLHGARGGVPVPLQSVPLLWTNPWVLKLQQHWSTFRTWTRTRASRARSSPTCATLRDSRDQGSNYGLGGTQQRGRLRY